MKIITLFLLVIGCSSCASYSDKPALTSPRVVISEGWVNAGASYPQSHAATLAQTQDGTVIAAWFGGLHERHENVAIYVARYNEGKWLEAKKVATGKSADGKPLPTWNPVLFQSPGTPVHLFYKVGPNPREWWGGGNFVYR